MIASARNKQRGKQIQIEDRLEARAERAAAGARSGRTGEPRARPSLEKRAVRGARFTTDNLLGKLELPLTLFRREITDTSTIVAGQNPHQLRDMNHRFFSYVG